MKKALLHLLICIMLFSLIGCGPTSDDRANNRCSIYALNLEASKLIAQDYTLNADNAYERIEEIYQAIATEEDTATQSALLPSDVKMQSWKLDGRTLTVDFNANYGFMEPTREVLVRAGVVRSFEYITEVANIIFTIENKELIGVRGVPVGPMRATDFIEESGKDVNAYNYVTIHLYFTNREGDRLVLEEREVYYDKNTPLERVVVEQLLEGPQNAEHFPTMPAETKILGASEMDNLGYVNLDQAFLNPVLQVQGNVIIQSIVHSILGASDVDRVQISINGETKVEYHGGISLDQFFEADHTLLEGKSD